MTAKGGAGGSGGAMKAKSVVFGYEQNKDLRATTRTEKQILQIAGLLIIGPNKNDKPVICLRRRNYEIT